MTGDTWAIAGDDYQPQRPSVFIQWKGTNACLDLRCTCGVHSHFDGEFAYALRCPACNLVWRMPHTVGPVLGGADDDGVKDAKAFPGGAGQ